MIKKKRNEDKNKYLFLIYFLKKKIKMIRIITTIMCIILTIIVIIIVITIITILMMIKGMMNDDIMIRIEMRKIKH
jgi:ABC-type lipoprotein release transport system permease subunit